MKNLLACLAILAAFNVTAQNTAPYNPDIDQDGLVGINDVLELLSSFGSPVIVEACPQVSFQFASMGSSFLNEIDFSHALLNSANFSNSFMTNANLSYVSGQNWACSGCYLENANFTGAYLFQPQLQGARMDNAILTDATIICMNYCPSQNHWPTGYQCLFDSTCANGGKSFFPID